ncbi:tyrosine-type recombinase/integrase [Cysteiniphilum sp. 6C5]|uniref:tyrosine-type recombinase/integrase n=1 Tax=unclassified Cysteiniphilum TaxID=2610889 RepID=UPI003F847982
MLTDTKVKRIKADKKEERLADGGGLYLSVRDTGSKSWLFRYEYNNKRKWYSFGSYPHLTLHEARAKVIEFKTLLKSSIDPSQHKSASTRFRDVSIEWLEKCKKEKLSASHIKDTSRRLDIINTSLGSEDIHKIKPIQIINFLRSYEYTGKLLERNKVKSIINSIFKYSVAMGLVDYNPCYGISEALQKRFEKKNYGCIKTKNEFKQLLIDIDGYQGSFSIKMALTIAPYVFLRPAELTNLEWQEVNFKEQLITIKAERMKMKTKHIVPMSNQVHNALQQLYKVHKNSPFVFLNHKQTEPIHRDSLSKALRSSLKYNGIDKPKHVTHGFRGTASTFLNEIKSQYGWNSDIIEKQLAHEERNQVRDAYNHAEYIEQRREMMQVWADYLDQLKYGSNVVQFKQQQEA